MWSYEVHIQDFESNMEMLTPEGSHSGPAEDPDGPPLGGTDSLLVSLHDEI